MLFRSRHAGAADARRDGVPSTHVEPPSPPPQTHVLGCVHTDVADSLEGLGRVLFRRGMFFEARLAHQVPPRPAWTRPRRGASRHFYPNPLLASSCLPSARS